MQILNLSNPHAFIIKSTSFPIFILQLLIPDVDLFNLQLTNLLFNQEFPKNSIIILDLQKISADSKIDFMSFRQNLLSKNLSLVGIIGGSEQQKAAATNFGIHSFFIPNNIKNRTKTKSEQLIEYLPAKLITTTIHSGQKICAKNRDLICIATVNHGAEIISDGNIHVYGKLSGRALAGASGNQEASIFCTHLDAELVSIAGFYNADLYAEGPYTTPVQIQLIDKKLQIKKLTP